MDLGQDAQPLAGVEFRDEGGLSEGDLETEVVLVVVPMLKPDPATLRNAQVRTDIGGSRFRHTTDRS